MDCLVTKLKGVVNDNSIFKLGEFRIKISRVETPTERTQSLSFNFNKDTTVKIIGDGYFTDSTLTENKGTSVICTANNTTELYVSNGDFEISVENKYELNQILFYVKGLNVTVSQMQNRSLNLEDIKYSKYLSHLGLGGNTYGDISNLKGLLSLTTIELHDTPVYGDIEAIKDLINLTNIQFDGTKVVGDISSLNNKSKLKKIRLFSTNISGSIDSLTNMPSSDIELDCGNITVTGDYFKFINDRTKTSCLFSGTFTYSSKNWNGKTYNRVGGDNFVCINLDAFLNDFQNVNIEKPSYDFNASLIKMQGTRTTASDAAISTLRGKGFTVTVPAATDANSISLMSVNDVSETYRIAYKDKELIVEPTMLQIYPASGVSVKEFNSIKEANAYITENGLVRNY